MLATLISAYLSSAYAKALVYRFISSLLLISTLSSTFCIVSTRLLPKSFSAYVVIPDYIIGGVGVYSVEDVISYVPATSANLFVRSEFSARVSRKPRLLLLSILFTKRLSELTGSFLVYFINAVLISLFTF